MDFFKRIIVPTLFLGVLILGCKSPTSSEYIRNNPNDPSLDTFEIPPPYSFSFELTFNKDIVLSWKDSTSYSDGFILQKSIDGINFEVLDTLDSSTLTFSDTSKEVTPSTLYSLKSFRNISTGINESDSVVFGIDFGEMNLIEAFYSPSPSGITLNWGFDKNWPFIVELFLIQGYDGEVYLDTLRNGENTYTYYFEQDFDERFLYARAYLSEEDLLNHNYFESVVGAYYTMEYIPEDLQVNVITENEVHLTWDDKSDFEDGFEILRSNEYNGANPQVIGSVPANRTAYIDTLDPFKNAYSDSFSDGEKKSLVYSIRAIKGTSKGGTNEVEASINMPDPYLFLSSTTENSIILNWYLDSSKQSLVAKYILQRSINGGVYFDYKILDKQTYTYSDTDISTSNSYSYQIKTVSSSPSEPLNFSFSKYPILQNTITVAGSGNFRYSDDGKLIVTYSNESILVFDVNTSQKVSEYKIPSGSNHTVTNIDIDEQRGRIAFVSTDSKSLVLIDYLNNELISEVSGLEVYDLEFSPDGKYIYTNSTRGEVYKYDINNNEFKFRKYPRSVTSGYRSISVSPDGSKIAYTNDGNFNMLDSLGNLISFHATDAGSVSNHVNFSGSGKSISFISHFRSAYIYDVDTNDQILGLSASLVNINYDDTYVLVYYRNILYLIDLNSKKTIFSDYNSPSFIRFSPTEDSYITKNADDFNIYSISDSKKWINFIKKEIW